MRMSARTAWCSTSSCQDSVVQYQQLPGQRAPVHPRPSCCCPATLAVQGPLPSCRTPVPMRLSRPPAGRGCSLAAAWSRGPSCASCKVSLPLTHVFMHAFVSPHFQALPCISSQHFQRGSPALSLARAPLPSLVPPHTFVPIPRQVTTRCPSCCRCCQQGGRRTLAFLSQGCIA